MRVVSLGTVGFCVGSAVRVVSLGMWSGAYDSSAWESGPVQHSFHSRLHGPLRRYDISMEALSTKA